MRTAIGLIAGVLSPVIVNNLKLSIPWYYLLVFFLVICPVGILVGRFVGKFLPVIYKLAKFGETGGLNWVVDLGVVNLLILLTGISTGIYFILFKAASFTVAVTNSYFWNKLWVFKGAAAQNQTTEVTKFISASLIGLAFNVAFAASVVFVGPKLVTSINSVTWANLGVVVGSLGAMLLNFVLYKIWVFKD
jgi:putative flippase GtrA